MDVLDSRVFHTMVASIRHLVGCEDVCMILHCHDATLCHPFLTQAARRLNFYTRCYGSMQVTRLLEEECVRAICDIAVQTGTIWRLVMPAKDQAHQEPLHILAAPLWRPRGSVGIIICTANNGDIFGSGEGRLLAQFLPQLAIQIEHALQHLCMGSPSDVDITPATSSPSTFLPELNSLEEEKLPRQDALLSMISHDFRTPLSVIKGYIGLLQTYGIAGNGEEVIAAIPLESQRRYLLSVMEQVQHLEVLVDDLLDLARIQSGRIAVRPAPLDLVALCQRVARQMQDRVAFQEAEPFTIQCLADADLPIAWADEHRVRQVLVNLVENAIKYSPEGGLIEILVYSSRAFPLTRHVLLEDHSLLTESDEPQLCITVRDHGIGISPRQQSIVFEPFLRLPQAMAHQANGLGLGLYIVRKLVEAMDGTIALQSSNGQGTSITLTLPIASTTASVRDVLSTTDKVLL